MGSIVCVTVVLLFSLKAMKVLSLLPLCWLVLWFVEPHWMPEMRRAQADVATGPRLRREDPALPRHLSQHLDPVPCEADYDVLLQPVHVSLRRTAAPVLP